MSGALATELLEFQVGPYHPGLPGPIKLKLALSGETIDHATFQRGYLHRGVEKCLEKIGWFSLPPLLDRVTPGAPVFGQLVVMLAVEELCEIQVPLRAQMIRVMVCELSRICSHLNALARVARSVEAQTVFHYLMRDRERGLDHLELLSGSRYAESFLRYGGVVYDVSEGFLERVIEYCDLLRLRVKEVQDLLVFNQMFIGRTKGIAHLTSEAIQRWRVTGVNARASGRACDVRRTHPYSGYDRLEVSAQATQSDCHGRVLARVNEILQSCQILKQVIEVLPDSEIRAGDVTEDFLVPEGESVQRVESPQGELACHLVSDGSRLMVRCQFRSPSLHLLSVAPELLKGALLEDFPLILASLDINVAEADR